MGDNLVENIKTIQALDRAIAILNCFSNENFSLTLNEISEMTNLNISTCRGLVKTLYFHGLLQYNEDNKKYKLGLYFLYKSSILLSKNSLYNYTIQKSVKNISDKYNLTSSFQLIENLNCYTIYSSSNNSKGYEIQVQENTFLPLLVTASGKLTLAYNASEEYLNNLSDNFFNKYTDKTIVSLDDLKKELKKIKSLKYSIEDQEYQLGVRGIAVPIFSKDNKKLLATISVTSFSEYLEKIKNEVINDLVESAEMIKNFLVNNSI